MAAFRSNPMHGPSLRFNPRQCDGTCVRRAANVGTVALTLILASKAARRSETPAAHCATAREENTTNHVV